MSDQHGLLGPDTDLLLKHGDAGENEFAGGLQPLRALTIDVAGIEPVGVPANMAQALQHDAGGARKLQLPCDRDRCEGFRRRAGRMQEDQQALRRLR